jgi:hypothetical protein
MNRYFYFVLLLINSLSAFSQGNKGGCPQNLNHNNGNPNFQTTVDAFDANLILLGESPCSEAGNSGNFNCNLFPNGASFSNPNNQPTGVWYRLELDNGEICWYDKDQIKAEFNPLPIELLSFEASLNDNGSIQLNWITLSESNNDFFTIEKSTNANDWQVVKEIEGNGNSTEEIRYQTYDHNPYTGVSYYRLKQTDFDGKYSYSQIISVEVDKREEISVYPNPTTDKVNIKGAAAELAKITVTNSFGKQLRIVHNSLYNSSTLVEIDFSSFPAGIYFIQTATQVKKLFKK